MKDTIIAKMVRDGKPDSKRLLGRPLKDGRTVGCRRLMELLEAGETGYKPISRRRKNIGSIVRSL